MFGPSVPEVLEGLNCQTVSLLARATVPSGGAQASASKGKYAGTPSEFPR